MNTSDANKPISKCGLYLLHKSNLTTVSEVFATYFCLNLLGFLIVVLGWKLSNF